jgi:hypothetical protein
METWNRKAVEGEKKAKGGGGTVAKAKAADHLGELKGDELWFSLGMLMGVLLRCVRENVSFFIGARVI